MAKDWRRRAATGVGWLGQQDSNLRMPLPKVANQPPHDRRNSRLDQEFNRIAHSAANRRWAPLFFDFRDFRWLLLWWLLAAALATSMALAIGAYRQAQKDRREAIEQERQALAQEREAVRSRSAAVNTLERQLDGIRQSLAAGDREESRKGVAIALETSQQLGNNPTAQIIATPRPISATEVDRIIEGSPTLPSLGETQHRQPVYIQFAGVLTRAQITALNQALKDAGWRVQGTSGERTPAAFRLNEVRFAGDNAEAAADLADALNRSGIVAARVQPRRFPIGNTNLEVWISR